MPDHVHMLITVPPKYAISPVIGFIKRKSAIYLARVYAERKQNFVGQHFLVLGLFHLDRGAGRGADSPPVLIRHL